MLADDVVDRILGFLGDRQLEVAVQLPDGTTTRSQGRCTLAGLSAALLQLHHAATAALELDSRPARAYGTLQPSGVRWRADDDAMLSLRFPFDGQRDLEWRVLLHRGGVHAIVARVPNAVLRRWPPENARRFAAASAALRSALLTARSLHLQFWRSGAVAPFDSLEVPFRARESVVGPAEAASRRTQQALRQR